MPDSIIAILILVLTVVALVGISLFFIIRHFRFKRLKAEVLDYLELSDWKYTDSIDETVYLKSSRAVENYDPIKFFKEDGDNLERVAVKLFQKKNYANKLNSFLEKNPFMERPMYSRIERIIQQNLRYTAFFYLYLYYSSPTGRSTNARILSIDEEYVNGLIDDPSLIMSKSEYNKFVKEQNQEKLNNKYHAYFDKVNSIIDLANDYRNKLLIKEDQSKLDNLVSSLIDKSVNNINRIKSVDSEEWGVIKKVIKSIENDVNSIVDRNQRILDYYDSPDFKKIKNACINLMESQKDFNEYISEKANSISTLFGTRVVRSDTEVNDVYKYIRPYKKTITPFTAEVSSTVFASAENNPLDYIVKYFYPNKDLYPEQIQKLQLLVEELETLKDAREIIENYKKDYQQYITDVPSYVMDYDEDGFYSRLGFANISETILTVEYKFSYTSDGGMAQRSFTIPMTEDTIVELIKILQSKLTISAFAKEQRNLMTSKLRQYIKERDNYTCKYCGNSVFQEPNLLLGIDHIVPVARGGCTVEDNLQTLCWKCHRQKISNLL